MDKIAKESDKDLDVLAGLDKAELAKDSDDDEDDILDDGEFIA